MELDIIQYLSNKDNYNNYYKYIKEHTLTKEGNTILSDIGQWYMDDSTREDVDWPSFTTWFKCIKHPQYKQEQLELYQKIFDRLDEHEEDETLTEQLIEHFIGLDYFTKIADVANRGAEGDDSATLEDVGDLVREYHTTAGKMAEGDNYLVTDDFTDLVESTTTTGLSWRLPDFNKALGKLRHGNLVIVASRPDSGKTSLMASELSFMAEQLEEDQNVVILANEEPGKALKKRIVCSALGITAADMDAAPLVATDSYMKLYGRMDKIRVFHNSSMDINFVEKVLKENNPGLIIMDQYWRIHGYEKGSAGEVDRLGKMFKRARELASLYAPVLAVHQLDGAAEGMKYPGMNHLYGTKTVAQGDADAIILLGRCYEPGYEKSRFLHIPKNKLASEDESMRNLKSEVEFEPEIARFKSML